MSSEEIGRVFAADGPMSSHLGDFIHRPEQAAMAFAIAQHIDTGGVLACEAGTGTGKTLAYLIPALASARRVVVSTGTKHLQDQLFHKDLPIAQAVCGQARQRYDTALLKGRGNYVCLQRLRLNLDAPEVVDANLVSDLLLIRDWSMRTRHGDIAELTAVPEYSPVWRMATSTRDNCLGSACEHFDDCFVFKARRRANDADLVVVNHHLLLAQFVLDEQGHGELLPAMDTLIVDEAHQLPELASEFFGRQLSSGQLIELAREADAARRLDAPDMTVISEHAGALERHVRALRMCLGDASRRVSRAALERESDLASGIEQLALALSALQQAVLAGGERGRNLAACAERASALSARLAGLLAADSDDHLAWFDISTRSFVWRQSPLDVSSVLGPRLTGAYRAVVLTSATLAVAESISPFLARVGLDEAEQAIWPSPFDFEHQSLLYVPRDLPDPRAHGFADALHRAIAQLVEVSQGRAFVLFTSHAALNRARQELAPQLNYPVLAQGQAPRSELLSQFRAAGNAVLLGTYSFWEGVDVRGDALSLVVIDKLPFAAPTDPLLGARLERLRAMGQDPFQTLQLPQAALTLKQGVGRLIRSHRDRGVVAVCDTRLVERGYGRLLRRSLPPMPMTRDLDMVRQFFERVQ